MRNTQHENNARDPFETLWQKKVFDLLLKEGGNGGNVFIGGDHGGGGWNFDTDRGPQMGWHSDGTVTVTPQSDGACPLTVLDPFPTDAWQTYRVEIDLEARRLAGPVHRPCLVSFSTVSRARQAILVTGCRLPAARPNTFTIRSPNFYSSQR